MFALGRLPGWLDVPVRDAPGPRSGKRISRPRQLYVGPTVRSFVPLAEGYRSPSALSRLFLTWINTSSPQQA